MNPGNIQGALPVQTARDFNLDRQEAVVRVQRNAIAADLRQINADLRLDLLQARRDRGEQLDVKTVEIIEWHKLFTRVLENDENPQNIFNDFKTQLQQILVDSIFRSALDVNCLLGNDKETYTTMGLQIYRNMAPVQLQNRSPLHPNREGPFETRPHECARYMVAWLRRHNINHRNAQNDIIEAAFRQLNLVANRQPPPVMDRDEAIRQIMIQRAQRQMRREESQNEQIQARRIQLEEERRAALIPLVRRGLAQVEQRVAEVAERQLAQAQELNDYFNGAIDALQPAIDHVEAELIELDQRERGLEDNNNRIQEGLEGLRVVHRLLEAEKVQLAKQIKENEKAGLKILGEALLTIGLCALGSLAIQCALQAMAGASSAAVSAAVKPMSKGFLLEATVKF